MSCSSSYPSSSKHSSSQNEQRHTAVTEQPNSVSLPLSCSPLGFILSTPFFRQPISSFPNLLSDASDQVRKSVLSNVDKCMKMLEKVASQNGFLESIISASSHLQNGFKIPRRRLRDSTTQSNPNFAAILPGDSVAGLVVSNGILNFLNIYNTVLVVRLVLTWFPNAPPQVVTPLSTLCDPYLNIFRGIIPPLGGTLDLSPILAFLVLNAFTSAASALPAELPSSPTMASHHHHHLTASQQKWMMRLSGKNKADKIH